MLRRWLENFDSLARGGESASFSMNGGEAGEQEQVLFRAALRDTTPKRPLRRSKSFQLSSKATDRKPESRN